MDLLNTPSTTGRFGTGFLTTYLLSKNVEVKGVFQHKDADSNLIEFRRFSLSLNRDAKDLDHMIELNSLSSKVFSDLNDVDLSPIVYNYQPG